MVLDLYFKTHRFYAFFFYERGRLHERINLIFPKFSFRTVGIVNQRQRLENSKQECTCEFVKKKHSVYLGNICNAEHLHVTFKCE